MCPLSRYLRAVAKRTSHRAWCMGNMPAPRNDPPGTQVMDQSRHRMRWYSSAGAQTGTVFIGSGSWAADFRSVCWASYTAMAVMLTISFTSFPGIRR
jgi:hypothetical protein